MYSISTGRQLDLPDCPGASATGGQDDPLESGPWAGREKRPRPGADSNPSPPAGALGLDTGTRCTHMRRWWLRKRGNQLDLRRFPKNSLPRVGSSFRQGLPESRCQGGPNERGKSHPCTLSAGNPCRHDGYGLFKKIAFEATDSEAPCAGWTRRRPNVRRSTQRYSSSGARSSRQAASSGAARASRSAGVAAGSSTQVRSSSLPLIRSMARRSYSYS